MQDPESRRLCVESCERELGERIPGLESTSEPVDDRVAISELIDRLCWRDAAIWVFVETIQDIYGPGTVTESLHAAVRSLLAEPLLSREERTAIHQLCASLPCSDAAALFQLSAEGRTLTSDPGNLLAVLNELEDLPVRPDGLPPILVFIELLAKEQPLEMAERLREWVDGRVGQRVPITVALRAIRDNQDPRQC